MYYVYMLRCNDGSIYTGITNDLARRMKEHLKKDKKCAKYTFSHTAKKLECAIKVSDRKLASKLEYHIKRLTKTDKEEIIQNHEFKSTLIEYINGNKYEFVDNLESFCFDT